MTWGSKIALERVLVHNIEGPAPGDIDRGLHSACSVGPYPSFRIHQTVGKGHLYRIYIPHRINPVIWYITGI